MREQVNPKGLPALTRYIIWNLLKLLWGIVERKKSWLNCILRFPLLFKMEFQVLKKAFFQPKSSAVSLSLLKQGKRLHLKLESSLILSYSSSWQALKRCMGITSKILVEFLNVHHQRIQTESIMMVLRLNPKRIIKE